VQVKQSHFTPKRDIFLSFRINRTGLHVTQELFIFGSTFLTLLQTRDQTMAEVGGIAGDHLRSFIERIERLEEEKTAIAADIKDVYAEAKGTGFDVKIMRQLIRLRKMEDHDRSEQEEILDLYKRALGME